MKKGDASGKMPESRWEPWRNRVPGNAEMLSKTNPNGYFLDRIEDFDASFFGISPREAQQMDPQQRLALELAWEALENAAIPPQSLAGSDAAVFMGVNSDDYSRLLLEDLPHVEAWMGVGTAYCGIPNRISYLLDLWGPSAAVDAACASSLVAIHQARQALMLGETSLAIAGGVNALLGPGLTRVLDEAGATAADGRCRTFDDSACGYCRGEGYGIVILKRMSDAIRDGDNILAALKGSAVGADGRTNGIMAPNQFAQEKVARKALKEAGLSGDSISFVEAHATSTPLGDKTESAAMANVYGSGSRLPGAEPCIIGSLKSNIGHLEAGAGVMGFIKAVMAVEKGMVPPQANLVTLNSQIDWEASQLKPPMEATSWPKNGKPRRAAIASYGYGGTVSHAIIEEAPQQSKLRLRLPRRFIGTEPTLLTLSATHSSRIKCVARDLHNWLRQASEIGKVALSSVAHTLAAGRGHHRFRAGIIAETVEEAIESLDTLAQGRRNAMTREGRALGKEANGVVWVFSGHGSQWPAMGKTLIDQEAFAEVIRELEPVVRKQMGFSVAAALRSGDFDSTDKIQIMIFTMQLGLSAVLKSSGIEPQAIIGHSLGELAAAVVAGAISLAEGALLCCVRARLFKGVMGKGAMVLVDISSEDAAKDIGSRTDAAVAIHSSPSSCVISGTIPAIEELSAMWQAQSIKVRKVRSDVAFHSPELDPLAGPMRELLKNKISPMSPRVPLYSTTLKDSRANAPRDVDYWIDNLIRPVLLTSTINAAAEDGYRTFLEVSSHPIITHSINETLMDAEISDATVIPTLLRDKSTKQSIQASLASLYCAGAAIEYKKAVPGFINLEMPTTRWDHKPYWGHVEAPPAQKSVTHDVEAHLLLGQKINVSGSDSTLWQTFLDPNSKPFPLAHPLHGTEIVPAAVLLHSFLKAAPGHVLEDVSLRIPVVIGPLREVQVLMDGKSIGIHSRLAPTDGAAAVDHSWQTNTTAKLAASEASPASETMDIESIKRRLSTILSPSFSVDYLANVGVAEMGFPWKVLEHVENSSEMLAKVDADPEGSPSKHYGGESWASILDAMTSVSSTIFHREPLLRMPTAIESVGVLPSTPPPKITYTYVKKSASDFAADVRILDEAGRVLVDIRALKFAGIEGSLVSTKSDVGLVHQVAWPPAQLAETPLGMQSVTFVGAASPLLEQYQAQLKSRGIATDVLAEPNDLPDAAASVIIVLATAPKDASAVFDASSKNCETLLKVVQTCKSRNLPSKVFCITQGAFEGAETSLPQASLVGLARIIQSEEPEVFGGLIDVEDTIFPLQAIKYVQGVDIVRIQDTVARCGRLRPFPSTKSASRRGFQIQPHGTYLITGGLGALGLELASYLAKKGAKRIVLVSRRRLPPRRQWDANTGAPEIKRMLELENLGVSIYPVAVDVTAPSAAAQLQASLDALCLPPVLGVVHAAGTLANQVVSEVTMDAFNSVISPKIEGAMALHALFPPKTLDFMLLFSSCGQLLGFPGQASYAAGNAFLDALATHRRHQGDNAISIQWTSWRGLGMAASTKYIDAELQSRGITDVTADEAFRAWKLIFDQDTDHAAVLRALPLEADDLSPHPILNDILVRKASTTAAPAGGDGVAVAEEPTHGPELEAHLTRQITACVCSVLSLDAEAVDPHTALSEMGLDSVMTVSLRTQLQKALKVKVGPTLIWSCPTVGHLAKHFLAEKTQG